MHSLYIVFNKYETLEEVDSDLSDQGFCNQGFFSAGKSDWFVIGGRWSGILSKIQGTEIEERDFLKSYGYKDDHQLITEDLFNKLKEKYNDAECLLYCNDPKYPDDNYIDEEKELSDVTFNEVEGMYITIVDYHS